MILKIFLGDDLTIHTRIWGHHHDVLKSWYDLISPFLTVNFQGENSWLGFIFSRSGACERTLNQITVDDCVWYKGQMVHKEQMNRAKI